MPNHSMLTIESISGTSYQFHVYPLEDNPDFPDHPGLYLFTKQYPNQRGGYTHDILYIGETHSFEERLVESHENVPCARNNGFNCVCLHYSNNEQSERRKSEKALIDKWNPICND